MKTLHTLVFCDGMLDADVVWYSVRVGISAVDQRAYSFVRNMVAADSRFFFVRHSLDVALFRQRVADSLFTADRATGHASVLLLRHRTIEIVQLARFLRHCPPSLLNGTKMAEAITEREVTLSGMATPAAVQLRKKRAAKRV